MAALLMAASLAFVVACSGDDTPAAPRDQLTSVTVRPERIPPNGTVEIKTAILNYNSEPLVVTFETLAHYGFEIETPDTVISSPCDPDSGTSQLTIGPDGGRILVILYTAYRPSDFCPARPDTLSVGKYKIRAGLLGHSDEYPWGEASFEVIDATRSEKRRDDE